MKKKGDSEIVAIVLLIMVVIFIIALLIVFVMRFLNEQEDEITSQVELQDTDLDIEDVEFDPADNQKLTLVLSKGQGGQVLVNLSEQNYSYNITSVNVVINETWVLNSTLVNITNSTMVNVTNSTLVNVTENITVKADIVFNIDSTGSMYDEIKDVKNIITNFTKILENVSSDWRLGLIEFKDYNTYVCGGATDFPFKIHLFSGSQFTTDADLFRDRVGSLSAYGGADIPESHLAALNESLFMDWREGVDSRRFEILLTDAPPHATDCNWCNQETYIPCYLGPSSISGVVSDLVYNNITLYQINKDVPSYICSGVCSGRTNAELMTDPTGGEFYTYTESSGVESILLEIAERVVSETKEVNITYEENQSWVEEVEINWSENVNITWWEQINETVNETVTIEVFEAQENYATLKVVLEADSGNYIKYMNVSDLPAPLETSEVEIDLSDIPEISADDVMKVYIYSVVYKNGKEEISNQPIAVWERPSLYSILKFWD